MLGKVIESNVYSSTHKFNGVNRLLEHSDNNLVNHKSKPFTIWSTNEFIIFSLVGSRLNNILIMGYNNRSPETISQLGATPTYINYSMASFRNNLIHGTNNTWG